MIYKNAFCNKEKSRICEIALQTRLHLEYGVLEHWYRYPDLLPIMTYVMDGKNIIGIGTCLRYNNRVIVGIYVRHAYRRKGIGTMILSKMLLRLPFDTKAVYAQENIYNKIKNWNLPFEVKKLARGTAPTQLKKSRRIYG